MEATTTMSIVECIICTKDLMKGYVASYPNEDEDSVYCTLTCGHLYHHGCIKEWIHRRGDHYLQYPRVPNMDFGMCPTCRVFSRLSASIPIYPVIRKVEQNAETASIITAEELNELRAKNEELQKLNSVLKEQLKESMRSTFRQKKIVGQQYEVIQSLEALVPPRRVRSHLKQNNILKRK